MPTHHTLEQLDTTRLDTPAIPKKQAMSSRRLAELKGIEGSIPNQGILINTLRLQEAKDSFELENIVTTHDELPEDVVNPAAKEVLRYPPSPARRVNTSTSWSVAKEFTESSQKVHLRVKPS